MTVNVAVIYYSATGTVHALAKAVAEGAEVTGARVRLRRVAELAVEGEVEPDPRPHAGATASVPLASVEDLAWADAFAFGTPTRFGAPAAQLKLFMDRAVELWREGKLADKPVTAFTAAHNLHGGNEATILSLANVFYHWGSLIVPTGYTDPSVYAAGGNPYGTSYATGSGGASGASGASGATGSAGAANSGGAAGPDAAALDAARYQGQRLARVAIRLRASARESMAQPA